MRHLLTFLITISYLCARADSGPKFSEQAFLKFYHNNTITTDFDSICAIVNSSYRQDTATIYSTTEQFWTRATLDKLDDKYEIFTHSNIKSFKVILFKNGKRYESEFITHYPGNSLYTFDISQTLTETSPLLYTEWYKYFFSLLTTLLIEFLIGAPFYFKYKTSSTTSRQFIASFILINLITHFSLWFTYSHCNVSIFILEIAVICIETIYWRQFLRTTIKRSILISLWTNLGSWLIGGLITFLIKF